MHAFLFAAYISWSSAPCMTRFWLMRLLEPVLCLAMLSMLCRWSGLRTRAIHECSMIGQMGMMYLHDGIELYCDIIKMFRLGWSTSGLFYKPILATLGPEFLSLDPRWAYNHSWACMGSPINRLTCLDHSMGYFGRSIRHTHKMFSTRCIHTRGRVAWG